MNHIVSLFMFRCGDYEKVKQDVWEENWKAMRLYSCLLYTSQVIGRLDLLRFRHIRGNDIVVLSDSDFQLCRGKQEVTYLELGAGQSIYHLDAFPIETAGISCKADILINSKDIFSFTTRLFNNAFHAFRHIIRYSICHGIVCTGFISLDGFRPIYDQCAVVLRGLNDGYGIAVSRHIRKRDVYIISISCVRLQMCIRDRTR